MGGYIKVDGVYRKIIDGYIKVNGVWEQGVSVSAKANGAWSQVWKRAFDPPASLTYPASVQRGSAFTWTVAAVVGAAYELQIRSYNGTWGSWGASNFYTNTSNSYTATTNISYTAYQLRVRAVDPDDHSKQSDWVEGPTMSLTPQKLGTPTGLTIPASIVRGDDIQISWNGIAGTSYTIEFYYQINDPIGNLVSAGPPAVVTPTSNGTAGLGFLVTTNTSFKGIEVRVKATKTGYTDSEYATTSIVALNAQKLGYISQMDVPHVTKEAAIWITWQVIPKATSYELEVDYDRAGAWTRIYTGGNTGTGYTYPRNRTTVQFRVRATAPNYVSGDWRYAWADYLTMGAPTLKSGTWEATWTGNWRPQFGGQWNSNNNYVYQGQWTDETGTWGNYYGIAIFNAADIRSKLAGKDIEKVQLYFYRINSGGYTSGQAIQLYTHNHASQPAAQPALWFVQGPFASYARGEGKWITVDNSVAARIRDNQATGIGLHRPDAGGYLYMSGGTNVKLYIEYR